MISVDAGIYVWENVVTGKFYVGSSRNCKRRMMEHRSRLRRNVHGNARLQASWLKHGEAAFVFRQIASVLNVDQIEVLEQVVIDEYMAVQVGYNLAPTAGNTAGWRASDETRKRMSEAAKRRDNSVQVKAMAEATRGKKRPQHVIDALTASRRGAKATDETKAKQSASARARSRYSEIDRLQMVILKMEGNSLRSIGAMFGVPHQCVHTYIKDWVSAS